MFDQSQATAAGTSQLSNTIAAVFATEHDARAAIKDLHKAGFRKTWLGRILPADRYTGEPVVEETGGGLTRFFSGDLSKRPLSKALVEHGASEDQAAQIENDVAPGCAILTVYAEDNPAKARELLAGNKADVVEASGSPTAVDVAGSSPRVGVEHHGDGARARARDTAMPDYSVQDDAIEDFYENRPSSR